MVHYFSSFCWAVVIALMFIGGFTSANAQSVKVVGSQLVIPATQKKAQDIHTNCVKSGFSVEIGGKTYEVWQTTKSGAAFVFAVSKAGKEYRKYLGKEATEAIKNAKK